MLTERTHTCGELRASDVGSHVVIQGWAQNVRDRGGVAFVVLRDRYGTVQVTVDERSPEAAKAAVKKIATEYVLQVRGEVVERYRPNADMATGAIEIVAQEIEVLSSTRPLPFQIAEKVDAGEETRLKYRFLDLRRPHLQRTMALRHRATFAVRKFLDSQGFYEMETPILTRATPEGARDYLVPSRVHPGEWYALPQSPQLFKQILMVAGYDRYFQIARCFRDEDLRADRQPEFTQIDIEMSFVTSDMVLDLAEGVARAMWKEALDYEIGDVPRLTFAEAIDRFGVDAPDMRFGMELSNLEATLAGSTFPPIANAVEAGGILRGFTVPSAAGDTSRKVLDAWTGFVRNYGMGGLLWGKVKDDGTISGPAAKSLPEGTAPSVLLDAMGAGPGDLLLIGAGPASKVNPGMGRLRVHVAHARGLVPEGTFKFCWVVDFPAFEREDEGDWTPMHHPFTSPKPEHIEMLGGDDMGAILSDAYDLVCNGTEIGGGSIRIHREDVQQKVFEAIKIPADEQRERFGFLLDALAHGAPPHGGLAFGLDRCIAIISGSDSIRDVIAFPKTTSATCLMTSAPSSVPAEDLEVLQVKSTAET
jgi:aspartyl-tRNA synthetase